MKITLAVCPFCGSHDLGLEYPHYEGDNWVKCKRCFAEGSFRNTLDEAVESWNNCIHNEDTFVEIEFNDDREE